MVLSTISAAGRHAPDIPNTFRVSAPKLSATPARRQLVDIAANVAHGLRPQWSSSRQCLADVGLKRTVQTFTSAQQHKPSFICCSALTALIVTTPAADEVSRGNSNTTSEASTTFQSNKHSAANKLAPDDQGAEGHSAGNGLLPRVMTGTDVVGSQRSTNAISTELSIASNNGGGSSSSPSIARSHSSSPLPPECPQDVRYVQDTAAVASMLEQLRGVQRVAVDCEGVQLGRPGGRLCLLQLSAYTTATPKSLSIWLVDIVAMGSAAFAVAVHDNRIAQEVASAVPAAPAGVPSGGAAGRIVPSLPAASSRPPLLLHAKGAHSNAKSTSHATSGAANPRSTQAPLEVRPSLRQLLESPSITKYFYDVRGDCDALSRQCGVKVAGAYDLQLAEVALRQSVGEAGEHVMGLDKVLSRYLPQSDALKDDLMTSHYVAQRYHKTNNTEVWGERPLSAELVQYAATDVRYMHQLAEVLIKRLGHAISDKVLQQTAKRMVERDPSAATPRSLAPQMVAPPGRSLRPPSKHSTGDDGRLTLLLAALLSRFEDDALEVAGASYSKSPALTSQESATALMLYYERELASGRGEALPVSNGIEAEAWLQQACRLLLAHQQQQALTQYSRNPTLSQALAQASTSSGQSQVGSALLAEVDENSSRSGLVLQRPVARPNQNRR